VTSRTSGLCASCWISSVNSPSSAAKMVLAQAHSRLIELAEWASRRSAQPAHLLDLSSLKGSMVRFRGETWREHSTWDASCGARSRVTECGTTSVLIGTRTGSQSRKPADRSRKRIDRCDAERERTLHSSGESSTQRSGVRMSTTAAHSSGSALSSSSGIRKNSTRLPSSSTRSSCCVSCRRSTSFGSSPVHT
jgi:hypothetical protein